MVEDAGHLMRGGDDGFLRGTARTPGSVKGAKDGVGSGAGLGRLSERLPGAVVDLHDVGAQTFAHGDVIVGSQAEPGTKIASGKAGHVGADLRDDGLGQGLGKAAVLFKRDTRGPRESFFGHR